MQKALILALLIGAFLLPRYVTAQEAQCPDGGTYQNHEVLGQICSAPAMPSSGYKVGKGSTTSGVHSSIPAAANDYAQLKSSSFTHNNCPASRSYRYVSHNDAGSVSLIYDTNTCQFNSTDGCNSCGSYPTNDTALWFPEGGQYSCPPDEAPSLTSSYATGSETFCYKSIGEPCDDPLGNCDPDEPPPECDDIVGNCTPPEDDPTCFRGGAGQLVCFEDPNDKCDVNTVNDEPVYSNCQSGCGFVNDNFLCSETPEIPSLDNCLVTTNGYACPPDVPEPDDNIDTPEKPIDNMVKNDFKDVLKGVETRTDATNKLLADQIARDKENTDAINAGQGQSNAYLKQIDLNTKRSADLLEGALEGDELVVDDPSASDIQQQLGITGDETFTDLELDTVSLDSYRNQFSWSVGSGGCPAPRTMNIINKSFTLEWEPYCDAFSVLGYFVQAAALLISGFIAFGVRK